MIGTKLYPKKSQVSFFLAMYGLLAVAGAVLAALSIGNRRSVSSAAGFMMAFGFGMVALTLIRSRKAQVSVHEDFLEVDQSRSRHTVRYRNIAAVSQPDKNRLVVTLREDGGMKNVVIWIKELDPVDVEKLHDFLVKKKGKGH